MHWRCFFYLALLCAATLAMAQEKAEEVGFYRFPTVYGDRVVFTSEGDLWSAPLAGGSAQRLTVHVGIERFPAFSPEGKWLAFSGTYDGNEDVFVIPATGGEPRRLTFNPASDQVCGWTPDGSVVFRSRSESPNYTYKLFKVSPQSGYPEP